MKVRAKRPPLVLDARMRLDAGHIGNRVRKVAGRLDIPLSKFWNNAPAICYTCQRERRLDQLHVGVDLFIRCVDRDECQRHWSGGKEKQLVEASPAATSKKPKYRVKG